MLRSKCLLFVSAVALYTINILFLIAQDCNAETKFSSAFTDLTRDCKNAFKEVGEGQDMPLKCKGYARYYIYIYYSAFASHITIKNVNDDEYSYLAAEKIDYDSKKGSKIEWRLASGKPFAVILKISKYNENVNDAGENPYQEKYKVGELLIIKGLKGYDNIDFEVNYLTTPDAITKARELADRGYLKRGP